MFKRQELKITIPTVKELKTKEYFNLVIDEVIDDVRNGNSISNWHIIQKIKSKVIDDEHDFSLDDYGWLGVSDKAPTVTVFWHVSEDCDIDEIIREMERGEEFLESFDEVLLMRMILDKLKSMGYKQIKHGEFRKLFIIDTSKITPFLWFLFSLFVFFILFVLVVFNEPR